MRISDWSSDVCSSDLIAVADPERHERDLQRVGAVRAADAVRHTDECSEMLLKLGDLGTQDELAVIEHASDAGIDLRPDARHLRPAIIELPCHSFTRGRLPPASR